MKKEEKPHNKTIDDVMESAFEMMYSNNIVNQLVQPDITDYERGKVAGRIEMMQWISRELNPAPTQKGGKDEVKDF